MKASTRIVLIAGWLAASAASLATLPAAAASPIRTYHETIYNGAPDLHLALAVVIAGGGPKDFQAAKLIGVLAGPLTKGEVAKLTREFGAANVHSFLTTFTFAIDDVLRIVKEQKIPLPDRPIPDPNDGGKLSAALVHAGTMPSGRYDVGYMIDRMISHNLHIALMQDINENPQFGLKANANFHIILTQAILDLKAAYGL